MTALGRRVVTVLPDSFEESVKFYVAPVLGLAVMILIVTVYGWLSPFKPTISISLFAGLLLLCLVFEKQRSVLFRDWLILCGFAIVATIPIFAPAIRFDSFNPFNDTFTYLVHGQWLQQHAFSEIAQSSGFFPAETQVVLYQRAGHRMGGSFFLGFVQSLFNLKWSYYAYLPTVGLAFTLGSLAIGGVIRKVVPVSRPVCLALCSIPALSMNGFVFGAQYGFLPQTFGLAFAAGLIGLIPGLIEHTLNAKPNWKQQFVNLLPLSLCTAALLIAYSDMFPVVGAGVGLFLLLMIFLSWSDRNRIVVAFLIFSVQVMAVVNVEGVRIFRNFIHTLLGAASGSVHFGWPVLWSPIQFIANSFGMKAPFDSNVFFVDRLFSIWIFPVLLVAIVVILAKILRTKSKNPTILLLVCINVIFWLAFLKFRYATTGLGAEVGNTFLQFKLSNWLAPYNIGLLGIAIAWLWVNGETCKRVFKSTVLVSLMAGAVIQFAIVSQMFTQQFQDETMQKHSPFNVFLDLRSRVASIPKDEVIYLGIPNEHHKIAQMAAYVMFDRKLAGSYKDGYLRGSLPADERDMPFEVADWMIQLKPTPTADENPLNRVGPFLLRRAPFAFYNLKSVSGAYSTETGAGKTWNWVNDSVDYQFSHIGKTPKAQVHFQYLLSGKPRTMTIQFRTVSGKELAVFKIPLKGGWGEYESPVIDTGSQDVVVRISADGKPLRLSPGDAREAKFLIQNIFLNRGEKKHKRVRISSVYKLESTSGAYQPETDGKTTWNWVKDAVTYQFSHAGENTKAKVKFQYLLAGNPRTLLVEVSSQSGQHLSTFKIPMKGGWGVYESPVLEVPAQPVMVHITADGEPVLLSDHDSRKAKFLIRNMSIKSAW